MRYLVALIFPWAAFFTMGKVWQGICASSCRLP